MLGGRKFFASAGKPATLLLLGLSGLMLRKRKA
jgi:hypothetical protein